MKSLPSELKAWMSVPENRLAVQLIGDEIRMEEEVMMDQRESDHEIITREMALVDSIRAVEEDAANMQGE